MLLSAPPLEHALRGEAAADRPATARPAELDERAHGGAADVRPVAVADVGEEAGAADPNRPPRTKIAPPPPASKRCRWRCRRRT